MAGSAIRAKRGGRLSGTLATWLAYNRATGRTNGEPQDAVTGRNAGSDRRERPVLSYSIDAERHLVVLSASGRLSRQDVAAVRQQIGADPAFDPSFGVLIDLREAAEIDLSSEDMYQLTVRTLLAPSARRALVVRGPAGFGIARMYQARAELSDRSGPVRVFDDDVDAAVRWLVGAEADS
jgi:hypothetical protein